MARRGILWLVLAWPLLKVLVWGSHRAVIADNISAVDRARSFYLNSSPAQ